MAAFEVGDLVHPVEESSVLNKNSKAVIDTVDLPNRRYKLKYRCQCGCGMTEYMWFHEDAIYHATKPSTKYEVEYVSLGAGRVLHTFRAESDEKAIEKAELIRTGKAKIGSYFLKSHFQTWSSSNSYDTVITTYIKKLD